MARVILDGYNLLLTSGRGAGEADREDLVRDAARYRGESAIEVTLVFDSRGGVGEKRKTLFPGVRVEFARGDADRHILEMVQRSRTPRELLVVTSDRRLAEQARDLGARTEDNAAFRKRSATRETARTGPGRTRRTEPGRKLTPLEVELWEREFRAPKKKDEEF